MKKVTIGITVLVILIIGATGICYLQGYVRFNYPDKSIFPIRGIDISHHQGQIDWGKLTQEDITFVFIKATEGGDFQDSAFRRNWSSSGKVGLMRGAYHFFTFCKGGKEQAANFIQNVPKEPLMLPPVIDFEYAGNCKARLKKEALVEELREYIIEIEAAYNKPPILYVTYKSYKDYLQGQVDDYRLWIRDIWGEPEFENGRSWTFWQYAARGRLHGIEGPVDLNVFNGSMNEFSKLLNNQDSPMR